MVVGSISTVNHEKGQGLPLGRDFSQYAQMSTFQFCLSSLSQPLRQLEITEISSTRLLANVQLPLKPLSHCMLEYTLLRHQGILFEFGDGRI